MSDKPMGEKTEQPTPHRLREARRKGQVVKSTDLSSACTLLAAILFFMLMGDTLLNWCREFVFVMLQEYILYPVSAGNMAPLIGIMGLNYFKTSGLIFAVVLLTGLAGNYAQVGFVFTTEKLSPTLEKINPLEGFKRIFSKRALFELAKALFKIVLVGIIVYLFLSNSVMEVMAYMFLTPQQGAKVFAASVLNLALRVGALFLVLAVLDYVYQRQEHFKNLKMTRQEVKEEHKQMEGDPLIRSKRKEKHKAMAVTRMMQEIPDASVVVTNPTELAIALKYDHDKEPVPKVVAKGAGVTAQKIRKLAKENGVPVVENRPVAQLLYKKVEIHETISADLYQAVAEILALVYEIQRKKQKGR